MRRAGRWNRKSVIGRVDEPVLLTLQMLGFDIPTLIEELLSKTAALKYCPCCGREVRPLITGRNAKTYKTKEAKDGQD
jgi:hypothetical protein